MEIDMKKNLIKFVLIFFLGLASFKLYAVKVVAIGDIHGDYDQLIRLLQKTNLIDIQNNWIGGNTVLVQLGDQIDRGRDDRKVIDFFEILAPLAESKGGKVIPLLGNHEIMNSLMNFSYVNDDAFEDFKEFTGNFNKKNYDKAIYPTLSFIPKEYFGRAWAFAPGGVYSKILSKRKIILKLDNFLFLHGGLLPKYAEMGIDNLNEEIKHWLEGSSKIPPEWAKSEDGPLWLRDFSKGNPEPKVCALLNETLKMTKTKFMVVGHTIQPNINSDCDGKIWRVDTGWSKGFEKPGIPQALTFDSEKENFEIIKAD
jgi:hypothetical protein